MVYLSNLSKRIKDEEVRERFSKIGKCSRVHIVRDPFTKESRGFGFVYYESSKDAVAAIENLHKSEFEGRQITVELSKRNRPHQSTPGVYLGPSTGNFRNRRNYSPRRRNSRSRSNRNYRRMSMSRSKSHSRSRSGSYERKK